MTADTLMKGPLLVKNLREAAKMAKRYEEICEDFEKHQPGGMVHEWKMMKRRWEMDPSQPDPYRIIEKGEAAFHAGLRTILTLSFRSLEFQFCETKTCGT